MSKKRRITRVDVAREAGVCQATVSYVLNNDPRQTIPEETRAKVMSSPKLDHQPYAGVFAAYGQEQNRARDLAGACHRDGDR